MTSLSVRKRETSTAATRPASATVQRTQSAESMADLRKAVPPRRSVVTMHVHRTMTGGLERRTQSAESMADLRKAVLPRRSAVTMHVLPRTTGGEARGVEPATAIEASRKYAES